MFIKKVIIEGFATYRERTVIESFDPRHNVVVGRNGCGKSNLLNAIQFVMSVPNLRPEQRQGLLYKGTGPRVAIAYVDIIFDNTDGRLPSDKDEVSLRRIIGAKNDTYVLNKKVVPRTDIISFLESAGFSKSKPFCIVKQGKVNQIATAQDSQRLKILREVAGTRVYDVKQEKYKPILKETERKLKEIEKYISTIDERLITLQQEKQQLKEYEKWDEMRQALEYTIHDRELKETRNKLDEMKAACKNSEEEQKKQSMELKKIREKISQVTRQLEAAAKEEERDDLTVERQQLLRKKTKLELPVKNQSDKVMCINSNKECAEREVRKLKERTAQKESDLKSMKPQYEEMKKQEECTNNLALKEQKKKELYVKHCHGSHTQNIIKELGSLNKRIKDKQQHRDQLVKGMDRDAEKKVQLERKIEELSHEMVHQRGCIDAYKREYDKLKNIKDKSLTVKIEMGELERTVEQTLHSLKENLMRAGQSLKSLVGTPIQNGHESIMKVLEAYRLKGGPHADIANCYYGTVIENITCDTQIHTAVEVTAGNRLFHHIVDSDDVATQLMSEMRHQKFPGAVAFIPLNLLQVTDQHYPDTRDAIPLMTKLTYEPKCAKALHSIFGNTLICTDLEIAKNLAKTSGFDCITLAGDQVSSKGLVTRRFLNPSCSSLQIQKIRGDLTKQVSEVMEQQLTMKRKLLATDGKINNTVFEMLKTEMKIMKAKDKFDEAKAGIRQTKDELAEIEQNKVFKDQSLESDASSRQVMKTTKEDLESELQQFERDLISKLAMQDRLEWGRLNNDIRRLTKERKAALNKHMIFEGQKNVLENLLNILMQQHEKQKQEQIVKEWKAKEKEIKEKIEGEAKYLEKMASEQKTLQQKIRDSTQKIQDLGFLALPDIYSEYQGFSTENLRRELEKADSHLKTYSDVNEKASEKFMSLSGLKEKLIKCQEELERGEKMIKEFMDRQEQKKREALESTYQQVSKNFSEVFQKLVPSGHAQLVKRGINEDGNKPEGNANLDKFIGVGIRVSFTNQNAEMREIHLLSGGQKSLVALGFILAIQMYNPAPFYIFDETDQALDTQHRTAVANMFHELSTVAQCIITTFRPELHIHANKFFAVKLLNKASHVECVTREVARDLVEDDTTDG